MSETQKQTMIDMAKLSLSNNGIEPNLFEFSIGLMTDAVLNIYRVVALFLDGEIAAKVNMKAITDAKDQCYRKYGVYLYVI